MPPAWVIAKVGDFNGDGKPDLLWRNTSSGVVAVWMMNGAAVAGNFALGAVTSDWKVDKVADYNGDGKAETQELTP